MKSRSSQLFAAAALVFCASFASAAWAQEPTSTEKKESPPPAAPAVSAPAADAAAPAAPAPAPAAPAEKAADAATTPTPPAPAPTPKKTAPRGGSPLVHIGGDVHLPAGESAEVVVAVFGSATSEGEAEGPVVSVLGDTRVTGPVNDVAVAVLGSTYVNSKVDDVVVAVLGNVELGPKAEVDEVVCIGGTVKRDPQAIVHGEVVDIGFGGNVHGAYFSHLDGLRAWFTNCLLLGRPLGFGEHLGWAWIVAGGFLLFYVLLALLFRGGVDRCAETLLTRPGSSILAALLTVLLVPVAVVLLCVTVVGIVAVPFIAVGMICATLFGKAVILSCIGRPVTRLFGKGPLAHAAVSVFIGGIIVMLLYTVPFFGFLLLKLIGWIGLGVVVYTLILTTRREKPAPVAAVAGVAPTAVPPAVASASVGGISGATLIGAIPVTATTTVSAPPIAPVVPNVPAATLPRAGFWIRIWALFLDIVLVAILTALISEAMRWFLGLLSQLISPEHALRFHSGPPSFLLLLAIYGALMWKFRGTTIGGIVCGLKVVRTDNRDVDWATAVVRALGCFLSLVVMGLGFIWIAIDADRQSWHDKIAGTAVVRMPKGVSLV
jgi:uncharacterized RDD family membrane protein YckC